LLETERAARVTRAPGGVLEPKAAAVSGVRLPAFADAPAPSARCAIFGCVRVTGVTANLPVSDVEAARQFYGDYLGLGVEEMNLGWVARYRTEDGRASVQVVTRDATSPVDSVLSVHVGDGVEDAYAEAQRLGYEIVHPLTLEPWGVRRFFVRDPDGNVINIVSHSDD
jgi:predicted enzyme related to lactoylglutathione lyase